MDKLPIKLKYYLIAIYGLTILSLYFFITSKYIIIEVNDFKIIIFFIVLMTLTESFAVVTGQITWSTSFAITIAIFILKGPFATLIVVFFGYTLRIIKSEGKYEHIFNIPFYKTLFNYCVFLLPIIYGNYLFVEFGGVNSVTEITQHIISIFIFCLTIFFLNNLVMSILFSIMNKKSILYYMISDVKLGAINFLAMAPLGLLAAYIFNISNYGGLLLFVFPIILARFTFSLYIESKSKYIQTVDVIMHAMEARDKYTEGHSKRVAGLVGLIARELKYNEWKMEELNIAALLHDVGKIGIEDQILNKPGKLTEEEYNMIKKHPEIGYKILKDIKNIDNVKKIVKYHHERYDGKGYPEGKKSDELSLDVFIVQLADSIDAMSTDRPYRKALNEEEVILEVKKHKGTQFHPTVVDAYFRAIEKQKQTQGGY